jgi:2-desacetyl-2-hydroxyethyl bacteriochlorophyllide A dehydrogenase
MTRRALVVPEPGSVGLAVYESLEPGPGEVVARTVFCGLCGSDLELFRGEVDPAFVRYPLTLGHEWSGVIEAVGPGVSGLEPGRRCVAEGIIPCGHCASCLRGATNVCETYDEIGFTREGAAGDQLLLPARIVHGLADDVSLVDAALVEPAAVVLTGLEKAQPAEGARVLVVGDGTIGLLAAMLAALWSPSEVVMVGGRAEQESLARSVGVTTFALAVPADAAFDFVIEAAGNPAAVETAVGAARRGGTVLLLGLPPSGTTVTFPADLMVNNDLTLVASFGYTSAMWARVVELLNAGRIPLGTLVTHRFPLEAYEEAFEALTAPTGARGKILLQVSDG